MDPYDSFDAPLEDPGVFNGCNVCLVCGSGLGLTPVVRDFIYICQNCRGKHEAEDRKKRIADGFFTWGILISVAAGLTLVAGFGFAGAVKLFALQQFDGHVPPLMRYVIVPAIACFMVSTAVLIFLNVYMDNRRSVKMRELRDGITIIYLRRRAKKTERRDIAGKMMDTFRGGAAWLLSLVRRKDGENTGNSIDGEKPDLREFHELAIDLTPERQKEIALMETETARKAVCLKWEGGARPDGYSLHISLEDMEKYIAGYWEGMPGKPPPEYSRPCGTAYVCIIDEAIYAEIKSAKYGIRCSTNDYPWPGGKDGWMRGAGL